MLRDVTDELVARDGGRSPRPFADRGCRQTLSGSIPRLHDRPWRQIAVRGQTQVIRGLLGASPWQRHLTTVPLGRCREAPQHHPAPAEARAARLTASGPDTPSCWCPSRAYLLEIAGLGNCMPRAQSGLSRCSEVLTRPQRCIPAS